MKRKDGRQTHPRVNAETHESIVRERVYYLKWFSVSISCVKWGSSYSEFFQLLCGIRQGGKLSPYLFAIFVDSIVDRVKATGLGCYLNSVCVSILLYADDIVLSAPSVTALQCLLEVCERELDNIQGGPKK